MNFNSISGGRFSPAFALPVLRRVDRPAVDESSIQSRPERSLFPRDQLSLGEDDDLLSSQSVSQLNYKSQLRVRQSENGETSLKFKSRLDFEYRFQSEDGTTVQVSAKIKTKLSITQTGEQSYALKARVKLELSLTQSTVQSGLNPLLSTEQESGQSGSLIASAFQTFAIAVEDLNNQFAQDALPADELIVGLVDAFNALVRSISGNPADPLPAADESLPAIPAEDVPIADTVPAGAAPLATTPLVATLTTGDRSPTGESSGDLPALPADDSLPAIAPAAVDPLTQPAASPIEPVAEPEPAAQDAQDPPEIGNENSIAESQPATGSVVNSREAVDSTPPSADDRRELLVELRIRFVQSLSQLVSTLDNSGNSLPPALVRSDVRQYSQLDLRLSAYDRGQSLAADGRLVDTRV